jgi:hypothetical protein
MDNDRVRASLILGLLPKPHLSRARLSYHTPPAYFFGRESTVHRGLACTSIIHQSWDVVRFFASFGGRALGTHCSSSFFTYHCALLPFLFDNASLFLVFHVSVRVGYSAYT